MMAFPEVKYLMGTYSEKQISKEEMRIPTHLLVLFKNSIAQTKLNNVWLAPRSLIDVIKT